MKITYLDRLPEKKFRKTKIGAIIAEFQKTDAKVAHLDWHGSYSRAGACQSTFNKHLENVRISTIRAVVRDNEVYLVKGSVNEA